MTTTTTTTTTPQQPQQQQHANRHVAKFLAFQQDGTAQPPQLITNGSILTSDNLMDDTHDLNLQHPILVLDQPESIGLQIPHAGNSKGNNESFTIRNVMNVVGASFPVSVINVTNQEELEGWTLQDLVDFFEDDNRFETAESSSSSSSQLKQEQEQQHSLWTSRRPQRKAAQIASKTLKEVQGDGPFVANAPRVLNQISMEFSRTPLANLVKAPQFVRDLDWIDWAWPWSFRESGNYPVVQHYCLTGTAGSYTDFHIDFGGTSVWYHVVSGQKQFILIPPTCTNLKAYEDWLCHCNQAELFFLECIQDHNDDSQQQQQQNVLKVTLEPNQTLVIPSGWIHAVYTPHDSLVFGGNFIHGLDIQTSLNVYCLETRARILQRFRFPYYVPLLYYTGSWYLQQIQSFQKLCRREVEGLECLIPALKDWWTVHCNQSSYNQNNNGGDGTTCTITTAFAARDAAQRAQCTTVEEMLLQLTKCHEMLVQNDTGILEQDQVIVSSKKKPTIKLSLVKSKDDVTVENQPQDEKNQKKKPKLKLRFKEQDAVSLVTPTTSTDTTEEDAPVPVTYDTPTFEIASHRKRKGILARESVVDAGSIVSPTDEEWQPKARASRKRKNKQKTIQKAPPPRLRLQVNSNNTTTSSTSPSKSKRLSETNKDSSRKRLMKRLGR